MEENQSFPKKNPLTALAFLKVGLVEFGFVAVVLFLLFGALNYFNILSVSDAFPKYLSWLPRKEVPNGTSQNFSAASKTTPTPTGFQYDIKKAETILTQYIKDTIKPEFLPAKIEVKQSLSSDGIIEDMKNEFGSFLINQESTISANFYYKKSTSVSNAFIVFIKSKNANQSTPTASLANSLLASYFINPYIISDCKTKGTTSYCENFQALNEGKKGYGIFKATDLLTKLVTCFIPKGSEYYALESCIKF